MQGDPCVATSPLLIISFTMKGQLAALACIGALAARAQKVDLSYVETHLAHRSANLVDSHAAPRRVVEGRVIVELRDPGVLDGKREDVS